MIKFIVFCVIAQILSIQGRSFTDSEESNAHILNKFFPTPGLEESRNFAKFTKFQCWSSPDNTFMSPLSDDLVSHGCPKDAKCKLFSKIFNFNSIFSFQFIQ
jgi:hypothetical protein